MGKHKSEGAETGSGATAASVEFPDPFPPLPQQPYRADDSEARESDTDPVIPAAEFHDADPVTDPAMPVIDPYDQFDPFAADAYRPELPWYRKSSAVVALAAIAMALAAILVAAVLLVSGRWGGSGESNTVTSVPSTTGTSQAPTTTPLTSAPPPPPPPPPPAPPPPAPANAPPPAPHQTYYPQYPRQNENGPAPRPQTRPPDISVRPTHRTAFPNQPGAN